MPAQPILIGVIGRAHGVRGLVHVTSYAAEAALDAYGPLHDAAGRRYRLRLVGEGIAEIAAEGEGGFVRIADRDAAAALVNTRLFVDRTALPAPEEEEFYLADLVGQSCFAPDGAALGRVIAVHDYGAGVSLEIGGEGQAGLIVPFTRAAVPEIDLAAGRIVIDRPAEIGLPGDAPQAGDVAQAGDDHPQARGAVA
ncbi:MAG: 16S rRNA processing protein RimM [Rhodospirillales bacterium]|nr:16S rRNA processing protein RimM [Rhodospirillales bacterium]